MTAQLPSRELLQKIIETANEIITVNNGTNEDISKNDTNKIIGLYDHFNDNLASPSVVKALAEFALAAHEQEPVAEGYRLIPLDALGAACGALHRYAPDSNTLKLLRRYTFGDLSNLSTNPAPVPAVPDAIEWPEKKFCPTEHAGSLLWSETEVWNKAVEACQEAYRAAVEVRSIKSSGEGV